MYTCNVAASVYNAGVTFLPASKRLLFCAALRHTPVVHHALCHRLLHQKGQKHKQPLRQSLQHLRKLLQLLNVKKLQITARKGPSLTRMAAYPAGLTPLLQLMVLLLRHNHGKLEPTVRLFSCYLELSSQCSLAGSPLAAVLVRPSG